jgi:hypothetical protein
MATDLAQVLLRKGVSEMATHRACCSACKRSLLPGELAHEVQSGHSLCSLCLGERTPLASVQVSATEKRLVVAPMPRAA